MQRSAVLFLVAGCVVAAVVVMLAFSSGDQPVAPPGGRTVDGMGSDGGNSVGTGPSGNEPSRPQGTVALTVPPNAPQVRITVTAKEQFVAPPDRRELAVSVDGTRLDTEIVAGVGAGFDAVAAQSGIALVAVSIASGQLLRQIAIDPVSQTAARIGARIVVRGRVFDARQLPVATAKIWLGEMLADGSRREFAVDPEGAFEADVPAGEGVPLLVRAPGYASKWRVINVDPNVQPVSEVLQPATTVTVQVAALAEQMAQARAFVVPLAQVSSELAQWPFCLQSLPELQGLVGGYAISEQGGVVIDDLPQHGAVGIVIRHPLTPLSAPQPIKLDQQPVRAIVPLSFAGSRLSGRVMDSERRELPSASVWCRERSQRLDGLRSLRLLPKHLDVLGACFATSDAQGAFLVGVGDEDAAILSVRKIGYAGRDLPLDAVRNAAVVLPEWRGGDASLRIQPPVAGAVWRVAINLGAGIDDACAVDEAFVVALPYAGCFDFEVAVAIDGREPVRREVKDALVTGPFELPTKPDR